MKNIYLEIGGKKIKTTYRRAQNAGALQHRIDNHSSTNHLPIFIKSYETDLDLVKKNLMSVSDYTYKYNKSIVSIVETDYAFTPIGSWSRMWDVGSGCVWDKRGIKKITKLN